MSVSISRKVVEDGAGFCVVVPSNRTRGRGQKVMHRQFHYLLNTRKSFFTVWMSVQRNRLFREVVESPSLEILKNCLGATLCNML